jgi:hypothetical protein
MVEERRDRREETQGSRLFIHGAENSRYSAVTKLYATYATVTSYLQFYWKVRVGSGHLESIYLFIKLMSLLKYTIRPLETSGSIHVEVSASK